MIGEIPSEMLEALFDVFPCDFTVTDANDRIIAWNREGRRLFARSAEILGADVRECHPGKARNDVEQLLAALKSGKVDRIRVWGASKVGSNQGKARVLTEYCALRGRHGEYLGCVEFNQNLSDLESLSGEKRTLD